jgi:hypothetical protein
VGCGLHTVVTTVFISIFSLFSLPRHALVTILIMAVLIATQSSYHGLVTVWHYTRQRRSTHHRLHFYRTESVTDVIRAHTRRWWVSGIHSVLHVRFAILGSTKLAVASNGQDTASIVLLEASSRWSIVGIASAIRFCFNIDCLLACLLTAH